MKNVPITTEFSVVKAVCAAVHAISNSGQIVKPPVRKRKARALTCSKTSALIKCYRTKCTLKMILPWYGLAYVNHDSTTKVFDFPKSQKIGSVQVRKRTRAPGNQKSGSGVLKSPAPGYQKSGSVVLKSRILAPGYQKSRSRVLKSRTLAPGYQKSRSGVLKVRIRSFKSFQLHLSTCTRFNYTTIFSLL